MRSMTGYGKAIYREEGMQLEVEIKSVNSRFLDLNFRTAQALLFLEADCKRVIEQYFLRGRVDVFLRLHWDSDGKRLRIQEKSLLSLLQQLQTIKEKSPVDVSISLSDLLRLEGMVNVSQEDFPEEEIRNRLLPLLKQALEHLVAMRREEGKRIELDLRKKVEALQKIHRQMELRAPHYVKEEQARIHRRVEELMPEEGKPDAGILETELALFAEKADIDEELVRFSSHFLAFSQKLSLEEPVGKTLDFLIQEMNREVNTISSKSNDQELTDLCISAKGGIEQLREQIQNIE